MPKSEYNKKRTVLHANINSTLKQLHRSIIFGMRYVSLYQPYGKSPKRSCFQLKYVPSEQNQIICIFLTLSLIALRCCFCFH